MLKQLKSLLTPYLNKIFKIFLFISPCILFYLLFVNIIKVHECTLDYNVLSGQVTCDTVAGIKIKAPWVFISNIDTRPARVCVDCSCNNVTCELVAFNTKGYQAFIAKEGWSYYWLRNRLSFNPGNKHEWRGMDNVLRGYAFDKEKYTFLTYENSGI